MSTSRCYFGLSLLLPALLANVVVGSDAPQYEKNAASVVRNLMNGDTYDKIYLKYHRCVWSEYGDGTDDYDGDNGCAGDGNGNYWYMGRTPCYRANVAYSLYGVPKGESVSGSPCNHRHYINTFFTTHGVENFAYSLGIDPGDATNQCTVKDHGGDDDAGRRDLADSSHYMLYPDYTSYTTSCGADGSFVRSLFQGAYCSDPSTATKWDELQDFNTVMSSMKCMEIYDGAASNDDQAQEQNNNADGASGIYGILSYSESCSPLEYPHGCPDPFGVKESMDYKPMSMQPWWKQMNWMDHVAIIFLILAGLLFLVPCCNFDDDEDDTEQTPRKRRRRFPRWCFRRRSSSGEGRGFRYWFRTRVLRRQG